MDWEYGDPWDARRSPMGEAADAAGNAMLAIAAYTQGCHTMMFDSVQYTSLSVIKSTQPATSVQMMESACAPSCSPCSSSAEPGHLPAFKAPASVSAKGL